LKEGVEGHMLLVLVC